MGPLRLGSVAVCVCTALALVVPMTASATDSHHPGGQDNFSPASRTVTPVAVARTTGSVHDQTAVLHGKPTTLTGVDASVTLDFGKEVGGLVSVHLPKTTAAAEQLGLAFTESSLYIGPTSDASNGGGGPDGALSADVTPGGTWTMPQNKLRGGFRYLTLFAQSGGPIVIDGVSVAITFAPGMTDLRDYANYFSSSDPLLNRIWYAGAYTVQTNTIAPATGRVWGPPGSGWDNSGTVGVGDSVLVDGAKRDRTVWPGDLGVSVPTEFASLGDVTPTRNALTTLYQHQSPSGELPFAGPQVNFYGSDTYHLWTLIGTANYFQYSHDSAWLASTWAQYRKALAFSLAKVGADGLMTVTGTADWARSDQGGENIEANALLYQALTTGAQLAQTQGDTTSATAWQQAAAGVKTGVNARLWDDQAGQYRDNPSSALHPQDGNALAVWFGLADSDVRAQRVSASLTQNWNSFGATTPEKSSEIGTFPGSLEVQAHFQAGDPARALDLIRREWGYMLNSPLGTGSTFWEGYLANGQPGYGGAYMSAAHGWATGPTSALTFYVLGIRPQSLTGGYLIKPEPGDLTSTEGSLKTPLGSIKLSWTHDVRRGAFTETLDAPSGAVGQVAVPAFGGKTRVTVNGRTVWNGTSGSGYGAHAENGYVVLQGVPGHAVIESRAVGNAKASLGVAVTSSSGLPVRGGDKVSIPVTVTAQGDRAFSGQVTAAVPAGWTATRATFALDPRKGATSAVVTVGIQAPAGVSGGVQDLVLTASSGGLSAAANVSLPVFGDWPQGTVASGSSEAAPNIFEGQPRTYYASNALDGNLGTFWNDATPGQFPDTLTVTMPAPVAVNGLGFASIVDGVPTDFTLQTLDNGTWVTHATITGNAVLSRWIPFDHSVTTAEVRIVVTASQTENGNYTRVSELTP
jgi:hypothetical protein